MLVLGIIIGIAIAVAGALGRRALRVEQGQTLSPVLVHDQPQGSSLLSVDVTDLPEEVPTIRGQQALKEAYIDLRGRANLKRVHAIWSGEYADITTYFQEEATWLAANPHVRVERVIATQGEPTRDMSYLSDMADDHSNLTLYRPRGRDLLFEVYLCEYDLQPLRVAGILVIVHPNTRQAELGFLLDGLRDRSLEPFVFTLLHWFRDIPKERIRGRKRRGSWNQSARVYDEYVRRDSPIPFLADFIQQEDELIVDLICDSTRETVFVEFGVGTGRTIRYINRIDKVSERVAYFIGFDDSPGMIEEALQRRNVKPGGVHHRTFFFLLDAARSTHAFGHGRFTWRDELGDPDHFRAHRINPERYENSRRVFACLLNTLGVMDAGTRLETLTNMFTAATDSDLVVVSVFEDEAFPNHARDLYHGIEPVVGVERQLWEFDDGAAEFRAGHYFSHWFSRFEMQQAIGRAGGVVDREQEILSRGEIIGRVYVCRRSPVDVVRA